ncbi:MAG: hypothetical protein LH610_08400 [Sphingomonas bacterium]|nr:hypothetical protein [Sphingomonas bacterium]
MSAAGYGALAAIVLVIAVGAAGAIDSQSNYQPAEATVYRIDRSCSFTRTHDGGPGNQVAEGIEQDCSATNEFKKIASASKRPMDVAGDAVVKVNYTAPQDGSSQSGELKFDGHDDQFYALKAGDRLKILVANKDLTKIRLD